MTSTNALPDGFETLQKFVAEWVLPDSRSRHEKRLSSDYDDILTFYEAMLPAAPRVLEYLAEYRLGELDAAQERLLKLMLALAEIGPAVEWYEQPQVVDGFPAHRFELVDQLSDTSPQEAR